MNNPKPRRSYPVSDPLQSALKAVAAKARRPHSSTVLWPVIYDRVFWAHPELVELYAECAYWYPEGDVA